MCFVRRKHVDHGLCTAHLRGQATVTEVHDGIVDFGVTRSDIVDAALSIGSDTEKVALEKREIAYVSARA